MRWVKRSLWILTGILAALVLCIGVAAVWIDSRAGKAWLEATINEAADGNARFAAIGGNLPFHPTVERIELADSDGPWANLRDVRLDLAPLDLLRRRVTVERLAAASIEITRLPKGQQAEPGAAQPATPSRALPQLPVAIDIRQLAISSLSLPAD